MSVHRWNNFSATSEELTKKTEELNTALTKEKATVETLFVSVKKTNEGSKERKDLINQINKQYGKYLPNLLTESSSLEDIEKAQRRVNSELERNFRIKIQNATLTDVVTNKIKFQTKAFDDFKKNC